MSAPPIPPYRLKYLLNARGLSYAAVDRQYGLPRGTCRKAAHRPYLAGELALAEVLDLSPRQIWPSRYADDGDRLRPQPEANYKGAVFETDFQ